MFSRTSLLISVIPLLRFFAEVVEDFMYSERELDEAFKDLGVRV